MLFVFELEQKLVLVFQWRRGRGFQGWRWDWAESGMVMQFLVRSEEVAKWEVDEHAKQMCGMEGVATGMRPDDSIWYGFD